MRDGFVKIAAAVPKVTLGDCRANTKEIVRLCREMAAKGVKLACFPELCVCGYTLGDMLRQKVIIESTELAVREIIAETADLDMLISVGTIYSRPSEIFNSAAVFCKGELLAVVAKQNIANYSEFYEARWFAEAPSENTIIDYAGFRVPFGNKILLECPEVQGLCVGFELCEDMWVAEPPSSRLALSGANVIFNLSCSNDYVGKANTRRDLVTTASGRLVCAYAYVSSGEGESTTDLVFTGHSMIAENGIILAEKRWETGFVSTDIDIDRLCSERRRLTDFRNRVYSCDRILFHLTPCETKLERVIPRMPFIPEDNTLLAERCEEILRLQALGLASRMKAIRCSNAVIGLSGGLDSTLALLVTVRAFNQLGLPMSNIHTITMPCFGTTGRTRGNAGTLSDCVGAQLRVINIEKAVTQHLEDIGHDFSGDIAYENAQARERTQVLMDVANMTGGIVVGTGDLSELALGWATFNGDHMSMYGVNADVPKTLVRELVSYTASISDETLAEVLRDILATPVSPELLPPEAGEIAQKTEDLIGPYELHDFFLYYFIRYGFSPEKIFRMARIAFGNDYSAATVKAWLIRFFKRFITQQFKRNCLPDGPKVGTVALSPRGDWRMPSDVSATEWIRRAEAIEVDGE